MPCDDAACLAARPGLRGALRDQIADALGPCPRAALAALVGLGLSDEEIARYHELPRDLIAELREVWNLAADL